MNQSMPSPSQQAALEPCKTVVLLVILAHALLIGCATWWATAGLTTSQVPALPESTNQGGTKSLKWLHPADFRAAKPTATGSAEPQSTTPGEPSPPTTVGTPQTESTPLPHLQAGRFITLSRRNVLPLLQQQNRNAVPGELTATDTKLSSLPDPKLYSKLDQIDEAIHQAFMLVWQPPNSQKPATAKRSARLDLSLSPSLEIEEADMVAPSDSPEFDLSILNAVDQVRQLLPKLKAGGHPIKIPQSLPSTFQNLRYDCRIQFQIE